MEYEKLSRDFFPQSHRGLVKGREGIICTILKEMFLKVYDYEHVVQMLAKLNIHYNRCTLCCCFQHMVG